MCFIDPHKITYRSNIQFNYINFASDIIIKEHVNQRGMGTLYSWAIQEVYSYILTVYCELMNVTMFVVCLDANYKMELEL